MSAAADIRRAIAALRGGRPLRIDGPAPLTVIAVETATVEILDLIDPEKMAPLLLSGGRAAALSLANDRDAADPALPVLIERADWLDQPAALALADPSQDFTRTPIGVGVHGSQRAGGSGNV